MKQQEFDPRREVIAFAYKLNNVQELPKHKWDKMLVDAMKSKHEKLEANYSRPDFAKLRVTSLLTVCRKASEVFGVGLTEYHGVVVIDHGAHARMVNLWEFSEKSYVGQDRDLVNMFYTGGGDHSQSCSMEGVVAWLKFVQQQCGTEKASLKVSTLIDKIITYVDDKVQ